MVMNSTAVLLRIKRQHRICGKLPAKYCYSGKILIFWSNIYILGKYLYLVKYLHFVQIFIFWSTIYNLVNYLYFGQRFIFWSIIYILVKYLYFGPIFIFWLNIHILVKYLYFGQIYTFGVTFFSVLTLQIVQYSKYYVKSGNLFMF